MVLQKPSSHSWAWVTSAFDEASVEKAIVLAGSLRRVKTSGKLVVITSLQVSEKIRNKLYLSFDLVNLLDTSGLKGKSSIEDHAKVSAFSLGLFSCCVYLPPNSLALKKCDEIFEKCSSLDFFIGLPKSFAKAKKFAACFALKPSIEHFQSLKETFSQAFVNDEDAFLKFALGYAKNNKIKVEHFEGNFYHELDFSSKNGGPFDGFINDLAIVGFGNVDPKIARKDDPALNMGLMESFAVDMWWNIYRQDVHIGQPSCGAAFLNSSQSDVDAHDPVAIVGMSCRFPGGANSLDEFWKLLVEGRDGIQEIPSHRWQKWHTITAPNSNCRKTRGGFLDFPIDEFDSGFFNISPKDAEFLDVQQRLLHEISWEALEDAAIDPNALKGTNGGVFVGSWIHDYKDIAVKTADRDFFRIYMGNSLSATAARLSFFYGMTGPSIASESGCSSAILAVDLACKSLRRRETNFVLAAGVNLFIHPFSETTMSFVLAPDGRCKTFDEKANGFGRAEGCAVLVMKRLSDAMKDGDRIWGLIKGSAVTQEGVSKSLGTPTVQVESLVMDLALKDAQVDPSEVSYVETHGTGTIVGDPMEVKAIEKVYSKNRKEPLWIGSVKTNVGHTEAASGITGIIKVLLSMKNEIIPPHLNFSTLNPEIDLEAIPAKIPLAPILWPKRHGKYRIAGVSSFGISGTDGHAIIQEAPCSADSMKQNIIDFKLERPLHIMKITGKTSEALDILLGKYEKVFESQIDTDSNRFEDIAYTSNIGRATFNHRAVIIARNNEEALKLLKNGEYQRKEVRGGGEGSLCFIFTGQGSQYPGMAKELYDTSPVFRMAFDKCNAILEQRHNLQIRNVIWSTKSNDQGLLNRTIYSQVSIFVVEYCLLRLWESWNVRPDYALGHSLGEFAAAVSCNVLDLESALELVVQRSILIDALPHGKMLVVKADASFVEALFAEFQTKEQSSILDFAALNSPEQTVLAGDSDVVDQFSEFCSGKGIKTMILASTHGFHSYHMDSILEEYGKRAKAVLAGAKQNFCDIKSKFISGMEGSLIENESILLEPEYWIRHTREKVNFIEATKTALEEGCNIFLEIGSSPVLSALVMANNPNESLDLLCLPSLRRNQNDWTTMLESLGKLFLSDSFNGSIDWKGFDQYYNRQKVDLPFHPFFKKNIWVNYRSTTGTVHPLVGRVLPNASKSTVFESEITLKKVSYLNDHAIGNTIIFPGAAFLEMSIVGGYCTVQGMFEHFSKPKRAITLKNFRIEAPLPLQDGKAIILQTIVDLYDKEESGNDNVGYSVKIHNWFGDPGNEKPGNDLLDGQWKTHATSCFLPLVTDELSELESVDIDAVKESWEKVSAAKELYEKLPEVGLRFGSTFQSLVCGWRTKQNDDGSEKGLLFEVKVPSDDNLDNYMVHPVVLDAMLQASMISMSRERLHKKLHVPVSIKEFTWVAEGNENKERYVYCTLAEDGSQRTLLLNGCGVILAAMSGVEFIETTVKLVESVIQQQSNTMPQLWKEIWKPKSGPLYGRVCAPPMDSISEDANESLNNEILQTCKKLNELEEDERKVYKHLDNLTVLYVLNALYKVGWNPKVDERIELKDFMKRLELADYVYNFLKYFFSEMVAENILEKVENHDETFVIKTLPGSKEDIEMLCEQIVVEGETSRGDYRIISEMGKGLANCLTGKTSPLAILFPEDIATKPHMGLFYDTMRPFLSQTGEILNNSLSNLTHLFDTEKKVVFRVLEVGAGTGSGTNDYLKFLESKQVNYEYTFTDVSAAFFINAEVKFEKYKEFMKYKKLDIDYDPLAQGFTPEHYDSIIACEAIHAAKDIKKALANLRMLLKTSGHVQITETTKPDRRITFLVGLLEGYWRFTDTDLRPYHATVPSEKWVEVFNECGYKSAGSIGCYNDVHSYIYAFASEEYSLESGRKGVFDSGNIRNNDPKYSWLVFCDGSEISLEIQRRLKCLNRNVEVIRKNEFYLQSWSDSEFETGKQNIAHLLKKMEGETFEGILYLWSLNPNEKDEQEQLSQPFLHLCQGLFDLHKLSTRVYLVTQGAFPVLEDSSCPYPQSATIWGIAKTLRNEQPDLSIHCIDLSPDKCVEEQTNELFYELFWWSGDEEELIAFREDTRLVPRLASLKIPDESLKIPKFCDRFQLILPDTRTISDLEFGFLNKYKLNEDEIEVEVKAAALNFRDIFAVLKPTEQFDKVNSIGSDFSGIVSAIGSGVKKWKVGDQVFGMNTEQQALPSHVKCKENMVIGIPSDFSFAEAATIPAVFATALYCLVSVAKIKKGDVILIHTASGGVGLSAIQIANHLGASIIATAGSRRKRAYLRSLGIEHVFHSRNTDYGAEIMKVTNGRGVDMVLNSLTGPGFKEASLGVCAKNARFVEMSKLNIWKPEEVKELREDVEYTVADLTALEEEEWKDLLDKMMDSMHQNFVNPIPYTRFDALNIRQALSYLQKAKHIGKVVCTMPVVKSSRGSTVKSLLFNDHSTYLITGGLGGIGFEVAKFILENGAKHLILVSRSPPKPEIAKTIKSWNEVTGQKVEAWQVDVGNRNQVKLMVDRIKEGGWPPLRGIMHAAGVLHDATIPNQSWEGFQKTYNAKVKGTLNLHDFTKDMRLEHFVLMSSVTSLFGSPGQANHTSSNAFEDSFAHYRHSIGLPATTINWANWGECGVAQDVDFPGIRPIATRQGLCALEAILKSNKLQTCVMNIESFGMVVKLFPKVKGYVDDKRLLGDVKAPTLIINTDQFWGEVDKADGRSSRIEIFTRYIKNMLRNILKMDPSDPIDDNKDFKEIGIDSLMLLEMKNYLQNLFGSRLMLTASQLKDCNSTITLATTLVDMLEKRNRHEDREGGTDVGKTSNLERNIHVENADAPPLIVV